LSLSKTRPVYFSERNVSEIGFCLLLRVKPTQLGPIDRASNICTNVPSSQTFRSYLRVLPSDNINLLIFVTEMRCIFCEVGTEYSDFNYVNFTDHMVKTLIVLDMAGRLFDTGCRNALE
jgi:hypothetical protein